MLKKLISSVLLLILVAALTACTPSSAPDAGLDNSEGNTLWSSEHYDADKMKGLSLNLYGVTDKVRPILDIFEQDTGIRVEHLTMKNGEILQRLENEYEAGVSIADLWFTGGADTFINAAEKGLLTGYQTPAAEVLDADMKDPDGFWHGTSLTLVNWVVNTALIEEKGLKMPEEWNDLLQDGLKDEVSMSNPASSGTAYNVITSVLQTKGEDNGWIYLEELIEQVPFFTARGSDPKNLVVNGEAIVGINASNGDFEVEKEYEHIKIVYPSDGTGWWPQPVAIVKGTQKLDAAKVFVDWLISKRGMQVVAEKRYAAVARGDIEIPEGIVDIKNIELFPADFKAGAQNRESILAEWARRVDK